MFLPAEEYNSLKIEFLCDGNNYLEIDCIEISNKIKKEILENLIIDNENYNNREITKLME